LKGNVYSNLPILNLITQVNWISTIEKEYTNDELLISNCCLNEVVISGNEKQKYFDEGSFDDQLDLYIDKLVSKEAEKERVNVEYTMRVLCGFR
jgi:hypothetical protein